MLRRQHRTAWWVSALTAVATLGLPALAGSAGAVTLPARTIHLYERA